MAIATIIMMIIFINLFFRFLENHDKHLMETINRNTEVLERMDAKIGDFDRTIGELILFLKANNHHF